MKILIALLILLFVDSIILSLLTKYNMLSKEGDLYKKLNLFLVTIPSIILVILALYFSTDTYMDWIISSGSGMIMLTIGLWYERRLENGKYISNMMGLVVMISNFILLNIIIISTLSSMRVALFFMLFSILLISLKSKNKSRGLGVTVTVTFIILIISSFLLEDYMNIKSKPLRIADEYIQEKGYDLDEIDHINIDSSFRGEAINMAYIITKKNGAIETILSMEYFEGEIIDFKRDR